MPKWHVLGRPVLNPLPCDIPCGARHLIHTLPFLSSRTSPSLCAHCFLHAVQAEIIPIALFPLELFITVAAQEQPAALRFGPLGWWVTAVWACINSSRWRRLFSKREMLCYPRFLLMPQELPAPARCLLSADGKACLNLWFIPHPPKVLVVFKSLTDEVCILCVYQSVNWLVFYISLLNTPTSEIISCLFQGHLITENFSQVLILLYYIIIIFS